MQGHKSDEVVERVVLVAGHWMLRPPLPKDAVAALAMLTDPEVARWNPAHDVKDLESAELWLARGADWDSGNHRTWSVVDSDDEMVGNVSLWDIDADNRSAGIGYRVVPSARRRGVASTGVVAVTRWAFESLGVERISLVHVLANPGSCGVARKAGFQLEGVLRQEYRLTDGTRWDSHMHSLLPSDLVG